MQNAIREKTNNRIKQQEDVFLARWVSSIHANSLFPQHQLTDQEVHEYCCKLFHVFIALIEIPDQVDFSLKECAAATKHIQEFAKAMAAKGLKPLSSSLFIFSLKDAASELLQEMYAEETQALHPEILRIFRVADIMGFHAFDFYAKGREDIVLRQQQDMLELSTPVIRVWDQVLAIPLIGTLDSQRTQLVMEKLLEMIVACSAGVVIVDITGVPTVDTLVANHLIKTANATKLLGCELIITGINPAIAQTIVHLGVDLSNIITRSMMADGIKLSMELTGFRIVKVKAKS